MNRSEQVTLAKGFVAVLKQTGLVGSAIAMRLPPGLATPDDLIQPSDGWLGWEALRPGLPEFMGDTVIVAYLRRKGSLVKETGRALYRGLERVMDLGAVAGLYGVPCGELGSTLHLRMT